ncbi:MAG: DUF294 nucleotidyltransferase-like domain-containing protein [Thermoleophilia bacterium]
MSPSQDTPPRTSDPAAGAGRGSPKQVGAFLAHLAPFKDLEHEKRDWVAASVSERFVPAHETLLLQGGSPGTYLFVIRDGVVELLRGERVVDVLRSGEVFGEATLITGQPPEFTARAYEDSTLYVIPGEVALDVLSRPAGIAFVATAISDRLNRSAVVEEPLSREHTTAVSALVDHPPTICPPSTTIREATRLMSQESVTAILVQARDGIGIVTNADLRDKVLLAGVSADAPVAQIMSTPVRTIRADTLAAAAAVEMMDAGVKHLVVVDAQGRTAGIISADSFMTLNALSPLALRRSLSTARDVEELVKAASRLPGVFLGLVDSRLDASAISRVLTTQQDAIVVRLLELAVEEQGAPATGFAWLALGSAARSELTLASDQDNALAYLDTDDPAVDGYFARLAQTVTDGLKACGFAADRSGVTASNPVWRLSASAWTRLFTECLKVPDHSHLMGASIAFDFRRVAGELAIVPPLLDIIRAARGRLDFLASLATTVTSIHTPLGFRRRLTGPVDVKKSGLLVIENLARYYALSNGITLSGTLDRLAAIEELGALDPKTIKSLRAAYAAVSDLRLRHHADLLRDGRCPDNAIDTATLPRLTHAGLQEALRVIGDAQRLLPQPLHGWG